MKRKESGSSEHYSVSTCLGLKGTEKQKVDRKMQWTEIGLLAAGAVAGGLLRYKLVDKLFQKI